jgi:methyl-accepting chemotaxis protein
VRSEQQARSFTAQETVGAFLRLEEAIDTSLGAVIGDTETSAQSIIGQMRRLHDSASTLASYLNGTSANAGDIGKEIVESVGFLGDIGTFIEALPAKMERDLSRVQAIVEEIRSLSAMTEDVKAVSIQSHLLGLNAAIEAGRAGVAGAAFKVVADEMRMLAGNSRAMSERINAGLSRMHDIVENGLGATIAETAHQTADVAKAASAIRHLRDNLEGMSQYYKTRLEIGGKHNEDLVRDIGEVLGQVQYQDVVRQCMERIRIATDRRDEALCAALCVSGDQLASDAELPVQLELILSDFLAEEGHHRHSVRGTHGQDAPLKVELF